jgi:hypothetical protein
VRVKADERLSVVKAAKEATEKAFSKMRAQGVGSTELNREILDSLNAKILKERMEMKINKATQERLHAVIVDISQGGAGLSRCALLTMILQPGVLKLWFGCLCSPGVVSRSSTSWKMIRMSSMAL